MYGGGGCVCLCVFGLKWFGSRHLRWNEWSFNTQNTHKNTQNHTFTRPPAVVGGGGARCGISTGGGGGGCSVEDLNCSLNKLE